MKERAGCHTVAVLAASRASGSQLYLAVARPKEGRRVAQRGGNGHCPSRRGGQRGGHGLMNCIWNSATSCSKKLMITIANNPAPIFKITDRRGTCFYRFLRGYVYISQHLPA